MRDTMRGACYRVGAVLLGIGVWAAVCAAPSRGETALSVTLHLQRVSAAEAAAQLARQLGAPVRVEGTRKAPLSVDVSEVAGRQALEAVAAAANGRWQRVYAVSGRGQGGGAGRLTSGRLITLDIEETPVAAAVATIAKAA